MATSLNKGKLLLFILLGVLLLGASSYGALQYLDSKTNRLPDHEAQALAQEIVNYGNDVLGAVQKLIANGCKETELSFENQNWKRKNGSLIYVSGHNPNSPKDGRCHVFLPEGGNIKAKNFSAAGINSEPLINNAWQPGSGTVWYASFQNVGTYQVELALSITMLTAQVCKKINNILGIQHNSIPKDSCFSPECDIYNGTLPRIITSVWADEDASVNGKTAFCSHEPVAWRGQRNIHHYSRVLLVR